jgi:hypothetical protein
MRWRALIDKARKSATRLFGLFVIHEHGRQLASLPASLQHQRLLVVCQRSHDGELSSSSPSAVFLTVRCLFRSHFLTPPNMATLTRRPLEGKRSLPQVISTGSPLVRLSMRSLSSTAKRPRSPDALNNLSIQSDPSRSHHPPLSPQPCKRKSQN